MATTKLRAGEEIDVLTAPELEKHLDRQTKDWFQEQARGVSTFHIQDSAVVSGAAVTFPPSGSIGYGPDPGFAWAVTRLTVGNLGTNDVIKVFWDTTAPGNFVAQITAAAPALFIGNKNLILRGGKRLVLSGSGLAATGAVFLTGEGMELAETDIFKLL